MIYKKKREFRLRKVGNQRVLLGGNFAFAINETVEEIWNLIDGEKRVDEIAESLAKTYDADEVTIKTEVEGLLRYLASEGAVTVVR